MATIVMTGGTAGLGRLAASRLLRPPNTRLLLRARSSAPRGAEALALEMTKLDNVRCFASALQPLVPLFNSCRGGGRRFSRSSGRQDASAGRAHLCRAAPWALTWRAVTM
jgi:NAD(P)-dependent dehydrogenase (short-subunit alcohol dehydrogenase family)